MLAIYYKGASDKSVLPLNDFRPHSWLHLSTPTSDELSLFAQQFHLDATLLSDAVDQYEVPRIEIEDRNVYIFTRYATEDGQVFQSHPFLIILTKDSIITLSAQPAAFIDSLVETGKFLTTQKVKLAIKLLSLINLSFSQRLISIGKRLRLAISEPGQIKNKDILQLIELENTLYDFTSSLTRIENGFTNFGKQIGVKLKEAESDAIDDLRLEVGQLTLICKDSIRTVVNIRDTYNTILTNNLNRVIKFFTSLTVVITIPNIIASFFGMNVALPLGSHPFAFAIIFLSAVFTSGYLAYIFIKKDWM